MRALPEIQIDLDEAYASRRAAMQAESYSMDSGQGRQTVTRNLTNLNKTIRMLEDEKAEAELEANGGGVVALTFTRH